MHFLKDLKINKIIGCCVILGYETHLQDAMHEPITESRVREIFHEEFDAITSQKHTPSLAPPCEVCQAAGNVFFGTVWNGWTQPNKKGKRRVRCRDCSGTWSIFLEKVDDSI